MTVRKCGISLNVRLDEALKVHMGLLCVTAGGLSWLPEAVGPNELLGGYKNKARTDARRKSCLPLFLFLRPSPLHHLTRVNATLCPV